MVVWQKEKQEEDQTTGFQFKFESINDSTTAAILESFDQNSYKITQSFDEAEKFSIKSLETKMRTILENFVASSTNLAECCPIKELLYQYFIYFIQHMSKYFLYLNESSHNFKLNKSYLKSMIEKLKKKIEKKDATIAEKDSEISTLKDEIETLKNRNSDNEEEVKFNKVKKHKKPVNK